MHGLGGIRTLEDELIRCPAHTGTNAKVTICHSISCSVDPGEPADLKLTMGIPASLGKQREQLKLKKLIVNKGSS